ncbi:hypothetical protein DPEC_G00273550 [Dallia pectoralis]|uniref:Uncharacterized protein n=1 Tax=Dallia pectoralis TaxID=75939 RepID=A0ACC2FQ19_DALPE|nr:hypothetical protein DPEC_G00273550 [Dallia pectoralis]
MEGLSGCANLIALTLCDTPLSLKENYRHCVINSIWSLKALDNHVVSDEEIVQNWILPPQFKALYPQFYVDLYPKANTGSYQSTMRAVHKIISQVNKILAVYSPTLTIQRWIRGYLTRKHLGLVGAVPNNKSPSVYNQKFHLSHIPPAGPDNLDTAGPDNLDTAGPDNLDTAGPDNLDTAGPDNLDTAGPDNLDIAGPDNLDTAWSTEFHDESWVKQRTADPHLQVQTPSNVTSNGHRTPEHPTAAYRTPEHPTAAHRTPEHPTAAHRTPEHPTAAHRTPEHPTAAHRTPEHPTAAYRTPEHPTAAHRTPEHPTSAHRTPEHPTAAHRTPEHPTAALSPGAERGKKQWRPVTGAVVSRQQEGLDIHSSIRLFHSQRPESPRQPRPRPPLTTAEKHLIGRCCGSFSLAPFELIQRAYQNRAKEEALQRKPQKAQREDAMSQSYCLLEAQSRKALHEGKKWREEVQSALELQRASQYQEVQSALELQRASQYQEVQSALGLQRASQYQEVQSALELQRASQYQEVQSALELQRASQYQEVQEVRIRHAVFLEEMRRQATERDMVVAFSRQHLSLDKTINRWSTRWQT